MRAFLFLSTLAIFGWFADNASAAGDTDMGRLSVISFNVESDADTAPHLVGDDIAEISNVMQADLFGLAEVRNHEDAAHFAERASRDGAKFTHKLARNGNHDRVAILYNRNALRLHRDPVELDRFPGSRKALVGHFTHRRSEVEFLFVVNHFNRRDGERRRRQARLIRDWVLEHHLPAIVVGDHNFDFDPTRRQGNRAFEIFTTSPDLVWIEPTCLADGTVPPTGTQCDPRYNSIMDFVFIADRGRGWEGRSEILMKDPGYCERERRGYSDHRPVAGVLTLR